MCFALSVARYDDGGRAEKSSKGKKDGVLERALSEVSTAWFNGVLSIDRDEPTKKKPKK